MAYLFQTFNAMVINAQLNISQITDLENRIAQLEKKLLEKNDAPSPYASVQDAQNYLKCSYSKIRRLVDRGFLKKNLDSRHIQILWSSIKSYVGTTTSS